MLAGFRAVWRGLRHWHHRGYVYIWANVFWALLTVLIVTAPAAWAGLVRLSYLLHRQPTAGLDDFWQGFRESLKRSLPIALANVVFLVICASNLISYANAPGLGFMLLRAVWILTLVVWLGMQYFAWCFFYAMKQPTYIGALRNAAVMLLQNPLFCAGVLLGAALIAIISTLLPAAWFLVTGGALAAIANSAVQDRLRAAGIEPDPSFDESLVVDPLLHDL